VRIVFPLAGSIAFSVSPVAIQTLVPSLATPGKGPYSRTIVAAARFMG
jgi:hypothetical protein